MNTVPTRTSPDDHRDVCSDARLKWRLLIGAAHLHHREKSSEGSRKFLEETKCEQCSDEHIVRMNLTSAP